jgi:hypothetical protein
VEKTEEPEAEHAESNAGHSDDEGGSGDRLGEMEKRPTNDELHRHRRK